MSVIDKLAFSLNRRDEVPNQQLAKELAVKKDIKGIEELFKNLQSKNKNIQSDCIKVLYEIALIKPHLLSGHLNELVLVLKNKNNRLVWGAMMALNYITPEKPKEVYKLLPAIIEAAEKGSVISRDNYVAILIKLSLIKQYASDSVALLLEQLKSCPVNQLPMYAENAVQIINEQNKTKFISVLQERMKALEKESQCKRLEKVLKKIQSNIIHSPG